MTTMFGLGASTFMCLDDRLQVEFQIKICKRLQGAIGEKEVQASSRINYDETFSPIVMLKYIQILMAITICYKYEI